jgi:hypothetical protein
MHHPEVDEASSWDATESEVHNLKVRLAVTAVMKKDGKASRVAVAQVHKTSKFGIIVFLDGEAGELRWKQQSPADGGSLGRYRLADYVDIGLSVRDGKCKIYVNDVEKAEGKLVGDEAKTCYFKTGCYNQDNNKDDGYPKDSFNEVHIAAVKVQHGVAWASGGYDPIGPGVGRSGQQGENPSGQQPQVTGRKPRDVIESIKNKRWKLNLDVNKAGEHSEEQNDSVEKSAKELADGFVFDEHFDVVDDGGPAVRFRSHLNGAITKTSKYPRTELREMQAGNPTEEAEWNSGGPDVHRLTARVKVMQGPSTEGHNRVSIGQIHDGDDLIQIMYDGKKKVVGYTWDDGNGNGRWQDDLLIEDLDPGERWFTYRIEAGKGNVRVSVKEDGGSWQEKVVKTVRRSGCYFKVGAYTQSSVLKHGSAAKPKDYGEALFSSIVVETVENSDD